MSDIVDRLRATITDMEFYEAPGEWLVPVEQAKAEIESLRIRLEIDPSHPYDGIYCRDETIRGLEKEIERLRAGGCARDQGTTQYCAEAAKKDAEIASLLNTLADARTESMRLRSESQKAAVEYLGQIGQLSDEITRLRAALAPLACMCDRSNGAACSRAEVNCAFWNASAALKGK